MTPLAQTAFDQMLSTKPRGDLWVFAYASLIWRPECEPTETRPALIRGWHRSLCMKSTVNRGTPELPGLVFALDRGGSCKGMALRISEACAHEELERLWAREMINAVYTPRWVDCHTPGGNVPALAFTLSKAHASYLGKLSETHYLDIFKKASGRFGTTWDYVLQTHDALHKIGIADAPLSRLVKLGKQAGLSVT